MPGQARAAPRMDVGSSARNPAQAGHLIERDVEPHDPAHIAPPHDRHVERVTGREGGNPVQDLLGAFHVGRLHGEHLVHDPEQGSSAGWIASRQPIERDAGTSR